jgi:CBS domain-containing protein
MNVKQAMHKGVAWVEPDTPVDTLAIIMREDDIGAIPVGENDRLAARIMEMKSRTGSRSEQVRRGFGGGPTPA